MKPSEKTLYLTFDDGPVTGPTEFALDQLSRAAVSATFFCIGDNIRKHPEVFRRLRNAGHAIGNHTFNHLNGWKTSREKYLSNVKEFEIAAQAAGLPERSHLFRPPYGLITRQQIKDLRAYHVIMWDVLSQDYSWHLSPEQCLRRTISVCRPGSIIVLHDSYKAQKNMEYTLPRLLDHFAAKGYAFRSLGQLIS